MVVINNKEYINIISALRGSIYDKANELNVKVIKIKLTEFTDYDFEHKIEVEVVYEPDPNTRGVYYNNWNKSEIENYINNLEIIF